MRFLLILLTLCVWLAMPAAAQARDAAPRVQLAQNDGMTLSEAVESVRRSTGGRIVSAETRQNGNREVHHIKVLTEDGKVKTYRIQGRRSDNG